MSRVTSVILHVHCIEDGFDPSDGATFQLDKINAFLEDFGQPPLVFLTPHMPRGKHPQSSVFGGGYNGFPENDFVSFLETIEWNSPENVVLIMQPEEGGTRVWSGQGSRQLPLKCIEANR